MAAQKKYPDELRERAVKMLFEVREREGKSQYRPHLIEGCLTATGLTIEPW